MQMVPQSGDDRSEAAADEDHRKLHRLRPLRQRMPPWAARIEADKGIVIDREKCDVCLKCADGCYAKALKAVAESMTVDEIMDVVEQDRDFMTIQAVE